MSWDDELQKLWSREEPGKVRRTEAQPGPEPTEDADRSYKAFTTRDRAADVLSIYSATGPSRNPSYSYLLDVVYDHHLQSGFQLIYSFMAIEVLGENLGPIVHAINFRQCESIREFHRKLYDPPEPGEPVIHTITLLATRDDRKGELTKPRQEEQA
jgi:hypothetical protein